MRSVEKNSFKRIGIDGRALEGQIAGIGRYVYELCSVLDSELEECEFFIYSRLPLSLPLFSARWHSRVEPIKIFRCLKSTVWLKTRCGMLAQRDNIDVFWATATLLPCFKSKIHIISTVHDLNYKIVPQSMSLANLWAHRIFFARDVRKADIVLTISNGTARRLQEILGKNADGVVTPAVSASFVKPDENKIRNVLNKLGIRKPYHLSVATWEPRKNLDLLINTYLEMKRKGEISEYILVLAGGKGWNDKTLIRLLKGVPYETIYPLGYVAEDDLPSLYAGASAFLFPSLYEGFGIPLLEARACGTLIIASDIQELRESGGNDGIYIQPTSDGIKQGIYTSLRKHQPITKSLPSWKEEGKKLIEIIKLGN